jgi:hypothetical protein
MKTGRFFAVIAISLLLAACASTKTVTVTEYRDRVLTDTVTVTELRVDSVYLSHVEKQRGDTIHVRDTIFKYRILHDTQAETKLEYVHDSIPYPVEVVKEVRKRNGYDRFTSWGFWILAVLILIRVAWWVFKTFYLCKA